MEWARALACGLDPLACSVLAISIAPWWWTIMFWAKDTSAALWVASTEADAADDVGAAEVVDDELAELPPPQAARVRDKAAAPAATPRRVKVFMTVVLLVDLLAGCRRGEVGAATAAPRGSSA